MKQEFQKYFDQYPQAKGFWFTSDLSAFNQESDAKNHGNTLEEKGAVYVSREKLDSVSDSDFDFDDDDAVDVATDEAKVVKKGVKAKDAVASEGDVDSAV